MRTSRLILICTVAFGCGDSGNLADAGGDSGADVTTFDSAADSSKDSSNDVADSNPCATAPTSIFYVDGATGNDTNSGAGPTCAFKTISAALVASSGTSHVNATINVAAGTYGAGETFPLVLDHGRSLAGAGASTTKIQGASATYNTTGTGSLLDTGTHFVTLLAGDAIGGTNSLGATTISGVTILPPSSVTTPTTNYMGLVCIAGNGPNTGTTPPLPTPSLVLKNLTVGPNFDSGITIGYSPTLQSGCNAAITLSTITGSNVGLATGACGSGNPVTSWPGVQIGDGQFADANTFTGSLIDVFGEGCGAVISINVNKFTSGYRGIVLVSQAAQYFEILGNTFDGATTPFAMGMGINTNASAVISKLNDNTFTNISESSAADTAVSSTTGYAVALGGGNVLQALRNTIHDNDNGIYIGGGPSSGFDFSSGGVSANRNQIYCNSKTTSGNGYDLLLAYAAGSAANFAGNMWDHAPPSTSVSLTTSANGTDSVTGTSNGATFTNYGAAITTACTAGRVH